MRPWGSGLVGFRVYREVLFFFLGGGGGAFLRLFRAFGAFGFFGGPLGIRVFRAFRAFAGLLVVFRLWGEGILEFVSRSGFGGLAFRDIGFGFRAPYRSYKKGVLEE